MTTAPAAADTILRFLYDSGTAAEDYDRIVTGDLGLVGSGILYDLLRREGRWPRIVLCYVAGNEAARRLYTSVGFVPSPDDQDEEEPSLELNIDPQGDCT